MGKPRNPNSGNLFAWVEAAPFRALLKLLIEHSNLPWYTMPFATNTPYRMVKSLLFGNGGKPIKHIRYIDAENLLYISALDIIKKSNMFVSCARLNSCLPRIDKEILMEQLILCAGIEQRFAVGIVNGWLLRCPRHVVWRCEGFIEMYNSNLINGTKDVSSMLDN
jgi:hypothetical protein